MGGSFRTTPTRGGLYVPGTVGNYASTPQAAAFDFTGGLQVDALVRAASYITGTTDSIVVGRDSAGANRGWKVGWNGTTGHPYVVFWDSGGTARVANFGTAFPSAESGLHLRWTIEFGADALVKAFASADGVAYDQIGSTVTFSGITAMGTAVTPTTIGAGRADTGGETITATIFDVEIRDGVDGNLVANPAFAHPPTAWAMAGTTGADELGNVWTLNGTRWEWRA